jgi:predicted PurR-regulated permease PerM
MQWLAVLVVVAALLYILAPMLTPFVAAAILTYICNPLVQRLCRWKVRRTLSVVFVMLCSALLFVLLLLIMLPLLQKEFSLFAERLPQWLESAQTHLLPLLQQWFGVTLAWDAGALKNMLLDHWQSAGGVAAKMLPWLGNSGGALLELMVNLLLIPVVIFYLLRDWNGMLERIDHLIPRHWHSKVSEIVVEIDEVLAEFLRGQISVMLLMSVFYVVVLWMVGLEFALPIGIVAGMLVFIPYLGMILGLSLATLAAAMQFGVFSNVLMVWAAFAVGQLLEGMVVTPLLVGERVGLHPLAVIFALMAFGQLFGFFGILLALPLAAILLVTLRHVGASYVDSEMYKRL